MEDLLEVDGAAQPRAVAKLTAMVVEALSLSREAVEVLTRLAVDLQVWITAIQLRVLCRITPTSARRTTRTCHRLPGWSRDVVGVADVAAVDREEGVDRGEARLQVRLQLSKVTGSRLV